MTKRNNNKSSSSWVLLFLLLLTFLSILIKPSYCSSISVIDKFIKYESQTTIRQDDGYGNLKEGQRLFDEKKYNNAAYHLWKAVLFQESEKINPYNVQDAFNPFIQCFSIQGKTEEAFIYVSSESFARNQISMGIMYLQKALNINPNHPDALLLKNTYMNNNNNENENNVDASSSNTKIKQQQQNQQQQNQYQQQHDNDEYNKKTPEELYDIGAKLFQERNYEGCSDIFELSCIKSNYKLFPSCSNAVYCRSMILDWGYNGTQHIKDMERISYISTLETKQYRINTTTTTNNNNNDNNNNENNNFQWKRSTSTHPHMMLGYIDIDSKLKRYVSESVAYMDDIMARYDPITKQTKSLPSNMPYDTYGTDLKKFRNEKESSKGNHKIRIGFISSGFNSKAVLYLSHDMFRFFNRNKYEIHIFSMGLPDSEYFIEHGMRGIDWRKRVQSNVCNKCFHDVNKYQNNHIKLAKYIHDECQIHILIEWDGYARQGERAQGLFTLRPAPIQILHQEYLGTSGSKYVDYIITDQIVSPLHLQNDLYTEKFIYMPNHFFSKGHAVQNEVIEPSYTYKPATFPYTLGTGSPQENRCLSPNNIGPKNPSIIFCNFNKFLKNNPTTVRSWIRILREVPNSMLCLLENPPEGVPYLRKFIHEAAGMPKSAADNDNDETNTKEFIHGDGDELNNRIHFLQWQKNPFDHQRRNYDFCNIMLDSYPYNGHTVAQDSLYGGVPIITRSDGIDMSSRVTTSANVVLGLNDECNAYNGTIHYENLAIELGNNTTKFNIVRNKLISTIKQKNPMHPYWDVPKYVKNFQYGMELAYNNYIEGNNNKPTNIIINETNNIDEYDFFITKLGTYDDILINNPPMGNYYNNKEESSSSSSSASSTSKSDEL